MALRSVKALPDLWERQQRDHEDALRRLHSENAHLNRENNNVARHLHNAQADIDQFQRRCDDLERNVDQYQRRCDDLEGNIDQYKGRCDDLEGDIDRHRKRRVDLERDADQYKMRCVDLESEADVKDQVITRERLIREFTETERDNAWEEIKRLRGEVKEKKERIVSPDGKLSLDDVMVPYDWPQRLKIKVARDEDNSSELLGKPSGGWVWDEDQTESGRQLAQALDVIGDMKLRHLEQTRVIRALEARLADFTEDGPNRAVAPSMASMKGRMIKRELSEDQAGDEMEMRDCMRPV